MRTILIRGLQLALVVLLGVVGYSAYRDRTAPRTGPAKLQSLGGDLVLGPQGIGKLGLGMTEEQADATGQVSITPGWPRTSTSTCSIVSLDGGTSVHFSRDHGLAVITVAQAARTPEGIGMGASVAQVAAAYPGVRNAELGSPEEQVRFIGYLSAPVPGNAKAKYIFIFHLGGGGPQPAELQAILLSLADQDEQCTHAG
ncbi:hypothetical protein ACQP2F_11300 [Actinoplanes sp. CA-030573]|uniref:hypothetical protein n=1 Tax=Actinoplanes sp. CA-030573 TaxID=3239898 RepID=UPI003D8AD7BE